MQKDVNVAGDFSARAAAAAAAAAASCARHLKTKAVRPKCVLFTINVGAVERFEYIWILNKFLLIQPKCKLIN